MINSYSASSSYISSESKREKTSQELRILVPGEEDGEWVLESAKELFDEGDALCLYEQHSWRPSKKLDENESKKNAKILVDLIKKEKYQRVDVYPMRSNFFYPYSFGNG